MTDPSSKLAHDQLRSTEIATSFEALSILSQCLLQLEDGSAALDVLSTGVSKVASLGEVARNAGRTDMAELCEISEKILSELACGQRTATPLLIDALLEMCDFVATMADWDSGMIEDRKLDVAPLTEKLLALSNETQTDPLSAASSLAYLPKVWPAPGTELDPELVSQFKVECTEGLQVLEAVLLEFERTPHDNDCVHAIFRVVHNIKGAADYVGLSQIKTLSHHLEDLLDVLRAGRCEATAVIGELVFRTVDELKAMITNLAPNAELDRDSTELITALMASYQSAKQSPVQICLAADLAEEMAVYIDSAEQQLESIAACCHKLVHGDASDSMLATLDRAITTLLTAATYLKQPAWTEPARDLLHVIQTLRDGRNQLRTQTIEHLPSCIVTCCEEIILGNSSDGVLNALSHSLTSLDETSTNNDSAEIGPAAKIFLQNITAFAGDRKRNFDQLQKLTSAVPQQDEGCPALDDRELPSGSSSRPDSACVADSPSEPLVKIAAVEREERSPPASVGVGSANKTMRVDQGKLDDYINLTGELVIARNALLHEFGQCKLDAAQHHGLKESVERMQRIVGDIQSNAMSMRMVPVSSVFQRFPRMVRDIAKSLGKQIEIKIYGEDTELDKQVAEKLGDPLVHLLRNSADHGIELPEARQAAGKCESGLITLKAGREGSSIVIDIIDDGRGIDILRLKAKAVEKGILRQVQADSLTREQALELIFAAGLSTAKAVSDLSGRGVGMDVVRSNITDLGGTISVTSEDGKGSQIRLHLPLTLAVTTVVLVSALDCLYAIPMESVRETAKVLPQNIRRLNNRYAFCLRDQIVPIVSLADVLSTHTDGRETVAASSGDLTTDRSGRVPIVVVTNGAEVYGISVNELRGQQEVIMKPLPVQLGQLPGIGGATIMGNGSVVLILDPASLSNFVLTQNSKSKPCSTKRRSISHAHT